ncbi:hypothetical protein PR048_030991 [Dryococelus australis]|uniref:Uncharacterized protein n=1 Tax=Dryococelus australis TaxID=614101 RepID=A0ABQ9G857_9NEOP|nr:hypothetical protein PR048_030991 [Dryococelus australis]
MAMPWTNKEIYLAFTLQYLNKRCYIFHKKHNIPLLVLQFNEVKIIIEYDVKKDEVVCPFPYMKVVMVRGLFSKWKQICGESHCKRSWRKCLLIPSHILKLVRNWNWFLDTA